MMRTGLQLPATVTLVTLAAPSCVISLETEGHAIRDERRFVISGTPQISLTTFDGAIEVRAWDGDGVLIEIERRGSTKEDAEAIEIMAGQEGDRIRIEARRSRGDRASLNVGFSPSPRASLIAHVPRVCHVTARSHDGSITIHEITGRIELRTEDGSIRGAALEGTMHAQTGDGSVALDAVRGRLNVDTGDGSVAVSGALASLRVRTSDGSIRLHVRESSRMSDDWDVWTGDGSITVELPSGFSAELDAQTRDGVVRVERGLSMQITGEPDRRTLRGTLGAGGRTLRLGTADGSIRLRGS